MPIQVLVTPPPDAFRGSLDMGRQESRKRIDDLRTLLRRCRPHYRRQQRDLLASGATIRAHPLSSGGLGTAEEPIRQALENFCGPTHDFDAFLERWNCSVEERPSRLKPFT